MSVYMYIYIYIHVKTHVYIYIYTHAQVYTMYVVRLYAVNVELCHTTTNPQHALHRMQ